jgi:GNAT superfamily N-acetyltransferase
MAVTQLERPTAHLPLTTRAGVTAWLSALAPGDQQPVREVFDGLSDRSRYFRFMASTPRLTGSAARQLAGVDHRRHVALVATVDGRTVGIGRYVREADNPRQADIAIAVVDAEQRRGLGSLLLAALGAVASSSGVATFTYLVHPQNQACVALLRPLGGALTLADGELVGSGPVPTSLLPPEAASALVRLVRQA